MILQHTVCSSSYKLEVYFSQEVDVNSELVCIHDSARPLVNSEDVEKVYLWEVAKDLGEWNKFLLSPFRIYFTVVFREGP